MIWKVLIAIAIWDIIKFGLSMFLANKNQPKKESKMKKV